MPRVEVQGTVFVPSAVNPCTKILFDADVSEVPAATRSSYCFEFFPITFKYLLYRNEFTEVIPRSQRGLEGTTLTWRLGETTDLERTRWSIQLDDAQGFSNAVLNPLNKARPAGL
jgi:hypothetical protein